MKFSSIEFWIFLGVVLSLYKILDYKKQNILLLIAGYTLYASLDVRFLPLMWLSTIVDYILSKYLNDNYKVSKRIVIISISAIVNIGLLALFKYFDFFSQVIIGLLNSLGTNVTPLSLGLPLPVGISFYTLQKYGYLLDIYREKCKPPDSIIDFALYTCFFPIITAGPIERSNNLMPQILEPREQKESNLQEAVYHISTGMFRKVVVADNLAPMVNFIFASDPRALTGPECLAGMYLYTFQIYFDFSGYSHIAQGVAKLLGFNVMWNFKMPYFSKTPSQFWNRWHISLSSWIRDYVYIPLGGNRNGRIRTLINLTIAMLIVGLWHGAAWNFVAWGIFHGILLVIYRVIETSRTICSISKYTDNWIGNCLKVFILFNLITIGWLLFRSESVQQAAFMLFRGMTDYGDSQLFHYCMLSGLFYVMPMIIFEAWILYTNDLLILTRNKWIVQSVVYGAIAISLIIFQPVATSEFIYLRF